MREENHDARNNTDRVVLNNGSQQQGPMFPTISASSHPIISLIHIILKGGIVAAYLLIPLITTSLSVLQFVIIAAAIDFWIVKNLAGRMLVGLRWWVDFDQDGEEIWKFECKVDEKNLNPANQKIFWWTLVVFSLGWIVLIVINVLKLDITQTVFCIFCGAMIMFNLYSYYKCSKVQSENVQKLVGQYGAEAAGKFMGGSIIANYF